MYLVNMYRVVGTGVVMFVAYEPSTLTDHYTITHHNNLLIGAVGNQKYLGNEPYSSIERSVKVSEWYDNNSERARYLVRKAFPEYANHIRFYSHGTGEMINYDVSDEWREVSW